MKRLIGVFLLSVVAVSVLSAGFARQSYAQTFTAEQIQQWEEENAELFKKWRESIPDYEKRLYDRVKGINKRVIRVQNLVIGSFVLLLIFNGVFLTLIYRRIGTGGTQAATKPATKPATEPATKLTTKTATKTAAIGVFFLMVLNLTLNIIRNIIRFIGKSLPPVVIAPDETPDSGSEDSNASLR